MLTGMAYGEADWCWLGDAAKLKDAEARATGAFEDSKFLSITFNDLQEACFVKDEQVAAILFASQHV